MPLPRLLFHEISNLADLAAKLDRLVLLSRNEDESYGPISEIEARITLSLAALQCHVEKGLSFDSPRLHGLYTWLKSKAVDSPTILTAPLRLAAAAMTNDKPETVRTEISNCKSLLTNFMDKQTIDRPILYMLSIEALAAFGVDSSNNEVTANAVRRLSDILHSTAQTLSVKSYAAMLLVKYGDEEQKKQAEEGWRQIADMFENDGRAWSGCVVETSYVILNAVQCAKEFPALCDTIDNAIDFLRMNCPSGIPDERLIIHTPPELGNNVQSKKVYAAAVIIQAIVEFLEMKGPGRLEFTHASWRLQVAESDVEAYGLRENVEVLSVENRDLGRALKSHVRRVYVYMTILGTLLIIALLMLPATLRVVTDLGLAAALLTFVFGFIKEYKNAFRFHSDKAELK